MAGFLWLTAFNVLYYYVCPCALSESDWKLNPKAVLCALETYDNYQQQNVPGSVKYIASHSQSVTAEVRTKRILKVSH